MYTMPPPYIPKKKCLKNFSFSKRKKVENGYYVLFPHSFKPIMPNFNCAFELNMGVL